VRKSDSDRQRAEKFSRGRVGGARTLTLSQLPCVQKPLCYRMNCNFAARARVAIVAENICACDACVLCVERVVASSNAAARTHIVKWSRCFLRCAVVIEVQCASIRDAY
jgi:hypothetical protein